MNSITSDIEKIIEDGKGWGSAWYSHDDKVQLDGTFSIQVLRDIANLVERRVKDSEEVEEVDECLDFDNCEQCGENAWDGRICHSCGMKHI